MTARDIVMSAAGNSGDSKLYVEDVFSTYLYTGNGSTQTINNGIDLAGKGGMVWCKGRNNTQSHFIVDTARGFDKTFKRGTAGADEQQDVYVGSITPTASGFDLSGSVYSNWGTANQSGTNLVSWTFRKAPKFFDVVTYTGNGVSNRQISHNLGTTPGMVIVKQTSGTAEWYVWHRGVSSQYLRLNNTSSAATDGGFFGNGSANVLPTDTNFTVGSYAGTNQSGAQFVAYLFAHDETADGLIQCGSYVGDASGNATINLGWEPQYLLVKMADTYSEDWRVFDTMRGWNSSDAAGVAKQLAPNTSSTESDRGGWKPTATGFEVTNQSGGLKMIYMAIRRGPMRTPTDGTKVFEPIANASSAPQTITTGFPVDLSFWTQRDYPSYKLWYDRLRGNSAYLESDNTAAENSFASIGFDNNTAIVNNTNSFGNASSIYWNFRRAPGFFDVVCYTGTGAARTVNHNLGVAPELMIVKLRSGTAVWTVYSKASNANSYLVLNNSNSSVSASGVWNNTNPTSSVFTVGTSSYVNGNGSTYVAYLFASCPGVSKVGSYTGNGSSQTINCGFSAGARFVLIKRTDSTGDWYIWDTARGIVASNDPHLSLNTTAAEVTSDDTIDPDSTGFVVNQDSATNVNVSGGSYIYLAIA